MEDTELTKAIAALAQAAATLQEAMSTVGRILERREEDSSWLPLKEASSRLGVSDRYLRSQIHNSNYKHGVHFVNTSNGEKPNYLLSVAAIRKELSKAPEKRNTVKRRA